MSARAKRNASGEQVALERVIATMNRRMLRDHEFPRTDLLWHYTSPEGLIGVVQGASTVWATHFQHMNDRSEVYRGIEVVSEELAMLKRGTDLAAQAAVWMGTNYEQYNATKIGEIFIASLSRRGDLLSQWRGYARNGNGYAIGLRFTKHHLPVGLDVNSNVGFGLIRCVYDEAKLRARIKTTVRDGVWGLPDYLKMVARSDRPAVLQNGYFNILARLEMLSVTLKDKGFHEEDEYRLVAFWDWRKPEAEGTQRILYRPGASGVVPYIPLFIGHNATKKLPLAAVRLGPARDYEREAPTIKRFLQQHDYEGVEVFKSEIPFRG